VIPIHPPTSTNHTEGRLLSMAALFLGIYSLALTVAPLVRTQSAGQVQIAWTHWLAFLAWLVVFNLAHFQAARRLPRRDPYLLPAAALLVGWGLLTIYRLFPVFGLRQTVWMVIAVGILTAGMRLPVDLRFLRRYKYLWLSAGLLLTALTLGFGTNPLGFGPRMWLGCCGIYLQPSEPLKLLLIIYLTAYLADRLVTPQSEGHGLGPRPLLPLLAPTLVMTGLALVLLLIQRDLGTASIFLFLYAAIVYIATGRKSILVLAFLGLAAAGAAGYFLFDVVQLRVDAWLNPWADPSGRSFQIVQSLMAVANGGLIGRGPWLGSPTVVPISHSDFIYAAINEEAGLIGALALILLIGLIIQRGLHAALGAPDAFRRYLAVGLTAFFGAQSILIIGGNIRLLPLTGVTLPFVSYGGSSLVTSLISLLLLTLISNSVRSRPVPLRSSQPILQLWLLLLAGLVAIAAITGWWAVYRAPTLLARTDNPRRSINDSYVRRGSILDRSNEAINITTGSPGEFIRQSAYPALSAIAGYSSPVYGQSGLEASLDPILRGLRGYPNWQLWWNHLLYGQPPPGLDIRTSLDLAIQQIADERLGDHSGAVVLLNAQSGEILAMASHPIFDSNRLDSEWDNLVNDPASPLINRAAQALYPLGTALGPLLLAQGLEQDESLGQTALFVDDINQQVEATCALHLRQDSLAAGVASGCPAAYTRLIEALGEGKILELLERAGIFQAPEAYLPTDAPPPVDPAEIFSGDNLRASPLQAALAAAALGGNGVRPAPHLLLAENSYQVGWIPLPPLTEPSAILPEASADAAAEALTLSGTDLWGSTALVTSDEQTVAWFLGGTLPGSQDTPLVVVVLLESSAPQLAQQIGRDILQSALQASLK
jgi:cell division protein FtsW (lipid II flippase)